MSENLEIDDFLINSSPRKSSFSQQEDILSVVEEKLSKLKPFIEENKYRIPVFSSSSEAENELKKLQLQLKKAPKTSKIKDKKKIFENEMAKIQEQHKQIEEENQTIARYRESAKAARESEEKEYKSFKKQARAVKKDLLEARSKKSTVDMTFTELSKSIEEQEQRNDAILKKKEQLLEEEKKLNAQKIQLTQDLQKINERNSQCDQDEKTLSKLEKATAEKMGRMREMERDLAARRSTIDKMSQEIKKLTDEAAQSGSHYDYIISKAANLQETGSSDEENYDSDTDDLKSDSEPATKTTIANSSLLSSHENDSFSPRKSSINVSSSLVKGSPIKSTVSNSVHDLISQNIIEEYEEEDENEKEISQIKSRIRELANEKQKIDIFEEEEEYYSDTHPLASQNDSKQQGVMTQYGKFVDDSSDDEHPGVMTQYGKFAEASSETEEEEEINDNRFKYTETSISKSTIQKPSFNFDDDEEEEEEEEFIPQVPPKNTKIQPLSQYDALLTSDSEEEDSDDILSDSVINNALSAINKSVADPKSIMKKY